MTLAAVSGDIPPVSSSNHQDNANESRPVQQQQEKQVQQQQIENQDERRDAIISKIERLESTLKDATNRVVRASCKRRTEQLQRDLAELDGLPGSFESASLSPSSIPFQPSASSLHVEPPTPQLIVQRKAAAGPSTNTARDAQEDSMERQEIIDEIRRVRAMLDTTTVGSLKDSFELRLDDLRHELKHLTPEDHEASVATSSSFYRVQDEDSLMMKKSKSSTYPEQPSSGEVRMVKVMAPTDLPGGYQFSARRGNGDEFIATVPAGGVKNGAVFMSPFVTSDSQRAPFSYQINDHSDDSGFLNRLSDYVVSFMCPHSG